MLWHIMKTYSAYGLNDFVICCGYKGYMIKEYFANYSLHMSDVTFDMRANAMRVHQNSAEPWSVTLVDTGEDTMTGGRLKRVAEVSRWRGLLLHVRRWRRRRRIAAKLIELPSPPRPARHGHRVPSAGPLRRAGRWRATASSRFEEKPVGEGGWINGGYFVLSPAVFDYVADDAHDVGAPADGAACHATASSPPLRTQVFGNRWTRCATRSCSTICGTSGKAPWKVWE